MLKTRGRSSRAGLGARGEARLRGNYLWFDSPTLNQLSPMVLVGFRGCRLSMRTNNYISEHLFYAFLLLYETL